MISKDANPIEWAMLLQELEDAKEHLATLIADISNDSEYDEANLRIDLGHIYSHLNRAWQRRSIERDFSDAEWEIASRFPKDLEPV